MTDIQKALSELNNYFDELDYPRDFVRDYDMLECLSGGAGAETFLVRNKADGLNYVARCYDKAVCDMTQEAEILNQLDHPQLPKYAGEYSDERHVCYLRQYIEGISLEAYIRENQPSREEIVRIALSLCDILGYLHAQEPPVIHRDIKPSNIIMNGEGLPFLIDFDAARTYKNDSESDTVFRGTTLYAPPEQYGFTQTDARSDIYSLGVTLRYMLTGNPRENPNIRFYRPLEKIIKKCAAFSPKERYKDIREVRRALQQANPASRMRRGLQIAAAVLLIFACAGFAGKKVYDYYTFDPFADGHIPSVLQDEERMQDACDYMAEKYGTHMFDNITDFATFALMKEALVEIYGMDHDYAWIGYKGEPPEESEDNFFPWPIGDEQYPSRMELCYFVVKIYWPDVVTDWSSLKDDNGEYPGSRVAYNWCEKYGILTGVNRPDDNSVGELVIALANADRVCEALQEGE